MDSLLDSHSEFYLSEFFSSTVIFSFGLSFSEKFQKKNAVQLKNEGKKEERKVSSLKEEKTA